jgi:hypothetical protein
MAPAKLEQPLTSHCSALLVFPQPALPVLLLSARVLCSTSQPWWPPSSLLLLWRAAAAGGLLPQRRLCCSLSTAPRNSDSNIPFPAATRPSPFSSHQAPPCIDASSMVFSHGLNVHPPAVWPEHALCWVRQRRAPGGIAQTSSPSPSIRFLAAEAQHLLQATCSMERSAARRICAAPAATVSNTGENPLPLLLSHSLYSIKCLNHRVMLIAARRCRGAARDACFGEAPKPWTHVQPESEFDRLIDL